MTQTEPALVASYITWPGNGAGLFLQPRNYRYYWWTTASAVLPAVIPLNLYSAARARWDISYFLSRGE